MNDTKLHEMSLAIDAVLSPEKNWDNAQKAEVLAIAGYSDAEINEYFEENAPF